MGFWGVWAVSPLCPADISPLDFVRIGRGKPDLPAPLDSCLRRNDVGFAGMTWAWTRLILPLGDFCSTGGCRRIAASWGRVRKSVVS